MTARPLLVLAMCGAVACTSYTPPTSAPAPREIYVRAPADTVWQRVIGAFADMQVPIATLEKASGIVVARQFRLTQATASKWLDCGKQAYSGKLVPIIDSPIGAGFRYIADFNVFVRPGPDSSAVRVALTFDVREATGATATALNASSSSMDLVPLVCQSSGAFERQLIERVSRP